MAKTKKHALKKIYILFNRTLLIEHLVNSSKTSLEGWQKGEQKWLAAAARM